MKNLVFRALGRRIVNDIEKADCFGSGSEIAGVRAGTTLPRALGALAVVATLLLGKSAYATEYQLAPGDVLSLHIVGMQSATFEVPIEADGTAWFPSLGSVVVSGLALNDLRTRIANAYSATSVRFNTDGTSSLLDPSQVNIGVLRYRPIYINSVQGQAAVVDFRPGLTLRQALVQARSTHTPNSVVENSDRVAAVMQELAQVETRIWGLRAMLGEVTVEDFEAAFKDRSLDVRRLVSLELAALDARESERNMAIEALSREIAREETNLEARIQQLGYESETREEDDKIVEDLRGLSERGLTNNASITNARRAALTSATRVLQLSVEIDRNRARIAEHNQKIAELRTGDVSGTLNDLADQVARFQRLSAELAAIQVVTPTAESENVTGVQQRFQIVRSDGQVLETGLDDAAFDLRPGDVVTVLGVVASN